MKAKKIIAVLLAIALCVSFAACGNKEDETKTVKVGASVTPHAEILRQAQTAMAEKGYELVVVEYNDYVIPNTATESGELDANYFQHINYLNDFNANNGTHLVVAAEIHYEPLGLYVGSDSPADITAIPEGATIAVPNDPTNEARALMLLEAEGIITLKEGAGLTATVLDIESNPKNIKIEEIEAAQLARSLEDVDYAVINGNYAIQGGLKIADAIAVESKESEAIKEYVNILVVKEGNEKNEGILALAEVLKTDAIKTYINETYGGAVVPMF
ncbi:MAG: MetQ/NlpA family ABC transporter substrate-binding protein [Eubacteriaceae bacterium]|nr:MetQ/NlpA family ABC transporter substrate-binding protein [Eubacteriaceae bacterium]